ncbi:beta-galactosidase [Thalassotalea crassostreae]|uniref:beta-galactosidase n=1 Tax=Thalassotalea crassostreae TaxID=1763536 RepID=UPI0012FD51DA|nr:beta-galactosidase [Thalassotalea crassostreae]
MMLFFLMLINVIVSFSFAIEIELKEQSIKLQRQNANASFSLDNSLSIEFSSRKNSKVVLVPTAGKGWDFSKFHGLQIKLTNTGNARFMPAVQLTSPNSAKWQKIENSLYLDSGETKTLVVYFYQTGESFAAAHPQYQQMNAGPYTVPSHWAGIDNANIDKITISPLTDDGYISKGGLIRIESIIPFTLDQLHDYQSSHQFPFVDKFGQYLHGDYPSKLKDSKQWQVREQQEQADLSANPGPDDRSKYGGWLKGPKQTATGNFYTKQVDGKWWFVDPEGYLFWSHGVTGVGFKGANTRVQGREHYFKDLPNINGYYKKFYSSHGPLRFDYTMANLYRKYGSNWKQISIDRNHQRLKSWGMNTYGNWSTAEDYSEEKTPFTVAVNYKTRMLEEKFPDPWDKDFANNIRRSLVDKKKNGKADSPFNIGFFVDNELHFFQSWSYAKIITSSPKDQPAKQFFVSHLQDKYKTIEQLNIAWKTSFQSFEELLANRKELNKDTVGEDGEWFYQQMVEQYYRICRESVKSVFPNHLYLGSRVHGDTNAVVLRAAEKYADVISYNLYRRNLRDFTSKAKGLTKPLMATEFHFGALDRGVFHTGLQEVSNQQERAQHYYEYVRSALSNPLFVGTHWFQYRAQAITGRGDGENYQIGLVDITDTPYVETIKAVRKIGYSLYEHRKQ